MVLNAVVVAILYACNKTLTKTMNPNQVVFLYKFTVFVLMCPWLFRKGFGILKTPNIFLHVIRGFLSIGGALFFMYGMKYVELVNATAIGYMENILVATIGIVYFKERLTPMKFLCVCLSLVGMFVIVNPTMFKYLSVFVDNSEEVAFNYYYLFIFGGIICWALNTTVIKILGNKAAKNETQAFYVLLFSIIFSYPVAFCEWSMADLGWIQMPYPISIKSVFDVNVEASAWAYLVIMALCYFVHVIAFFLAYKNADILTIMPFDYTRLIFTALLGIIVLHEYPKNNAYVGASMIALSGILMIKNEYKRKKQQKDEKSQNLEIEIENV
jgi:S-adenosylmethionine uptake transporter